MTAEVLKAIENLQNEMAKFSSNEQIKIIHESAFLNTIYNYGYRCGLSEMQIMANNGLI